MGAELEPKPVQRRDEDQDDADQDADGASGLYPLNQAIHDPPIRVVRPCRPLWRLPDRRRSTET